MGTSLGRFSLSCEEGKQYELAVWLLRKSCSTCRIGIDSKWHVWVGKEAILHLSHLKRHAIYTVSAMQTCAKADQLNGSKGQGYHVGSILPVSKVFAAGCALSSTVGLPLCR